MFIQLPNVQPLIKKNLVVILASDYTRKRKMKRVTFKVEFYSIRTEYFENLLLATQLTIILMY